LYPDTYRIKPDSDANSVVDVLLDQFQSQIARKTSLPDDAFYNILVLASIVEREEKNSENKSIVAGIL